ncbi:MAG: hypothetical protein OEX02_04530 [Cyclobacteriaceae bacterium]|nr:hypothetical protein [Cyclobacteriaceae bacterium]
MKTIAVLDAGYTSYQYEQELLKEVGYEVVINKAAITDNTHKMKMASQAEGIFIRWTDIDKPFLDYCPKLKYIVRYGTGYDNINLSACRERGVKVSNVTGYARHSVSNHALSLIFGCARDLLNGNRNLMETYSAPPDYQLTDFHNKTLGIIGLGKIGGTISKKAGSLFKRIIASDPYITTKDFQEKGAEKKTLEELLALSDIITIHCNLTEETTHLINDTTIHKMKTGIILVNTARGPVIDSKALLKHLNNGKIWRAGIDVFDTEIPQELDHKLIRHPNIITTGHYAWYSKEAHIALQQLAAQNMLSFLKGSIPEDCLNCT